MQHKYYLELNEAQAICLRTALRNEIVDLRKERKELKKNIEYAKTFNPDDKKYMILLKSDLEENKMMIAKLEQLKTKLYDIL